MRLHPNAVPLVLIGIGGILLSLALHWARRVREAREAQVEYDRRRAEAVLRALEASRDRG